MRVFNKLVKKIHSPICLIFVATLSFPLQASEFALMIFDITKMALTTDLNITSISNEETHIKIKGNTPIKFLVHDFSNKIFQSRDLSSYNFIDVIPFWEKNEFVIILKQKDKTQMTNKSHFVTIVDPPARHKIIGSTTFKGTCSRNGADVIISGDLKGKAVCHNGRWEFNGSVPLKEKMPVIGIDVSHASINQDFAKDYRSFILP